MVLVGCLLLLDSSLAQIPDVISVQGRISDQGQPVSGAQMVTLRLMSAPVGGSEITSETSVVVFDDTGLFVASTGEQQSIPTTALEGALWAELELPSLGGPLGPRVSMVPAPQALVAKRSLQPGSSRELHVFHSGSDSDSGDRLLEAFAGIQDCSEERPYLVHLGAGVFDLGGGSLVMPSGLAIEGAGSRVSVIRSSGHSSLASGTVECQGLCTLRDLAIANTGVSDFSVGLLAISSAADVVGSRIEISAAEANLRAVGVLVGGSGVVDLQGFRVSGVVGGLGGDAQGLWLDGPGAVIRLTGGVIEADSLAGEAVGFHLDGGSSANLRDTNLEVKARGGGADGLGIRAQGDSSILMSNSSVDGQVLEDGGTLVGIEVAGGVSGATLRNCRVRLVPGPLVSSASGSGVLASDGAGVLVLGGEVQVAGSSLVGAALHSAGGAGSSRVKAIGSYLLSSGTGAKVASGSELSIISGELTGMTTSTEGAVTCYGVVDSSIQDGGTSSTCP